MKKRFILLLVLLLILLVAATLVESGGTNYFPSVGLTGINPLQFISSYLPYPPPCTSATAGQVYRITLPSGATELFYCRGDDFRYMTPGFAFSAYSGLGPGATGPPTGVAFARLTPRDPTFGTVVLGGVLIQDSGTGVGNAVFEIFQGAVVLCSVTFPCAAAIGNEYTTFPCPSNTFIPSSVGGTVKGRYGAGSACTKNPTIIIETQYDIGPRFP